ncbi:hypothetical protein LZ009_14935 [Ramlibacter sp. XY19]|uniref:hypothetical protein n=1 Tax=Ramlibacter paludis TaxID=2908000 RepID=UPI0023DB6DF2|nr:hypothetical protein [Ramlibacter paludis]MCG2594074.1 hypothetical protein [Ramlibacter paludis]
MFAAFSRLIAFSTLSCLLLAPVLARADTAAGAKMVPTRGTPAQVEGTWCGIGLLHEFTLQINQQYQAFEARLSRKNKVREITGQIKGDTLITDPQRNVVLVLKAMNDELRITQGTGQFALAQGQGFARARSGGCSGT